MKSQKLKLYDDKLRKNHGNILCGIDEVGRGSWAGPLGAGACILPEDCEIDGLNDSKQLTSEQRNDLAIIIKNKATAWKVIFIEPQDIDDRGITWANSQAMLLAAKDCASQIDKAVSLYVIDQAPSFPIRPHLMIPKADGTSLCVAAASVLAKVERDNFMIELAKEYPEYGFDDHKGYINEQHKIAVRKYGLISKIHRFSYKVKNITERQTSLADLL